MNASPGVHCGVVVPFLSCTATAALPGGVLGMAVEAGKGSGVGAREAAPVKDGDKEALAMCAASNGVASDRNGHRGSVKQ